MTIDKPLYRVPLMDEIAAVPWNGRKVASLFAGCGGSSLGYRMAGYRILWANEFVPAAREVYERNAREGTIVDARDVREIKPEELLRACGLRKGDLDILDGSPPCASFSTSGKRQAGWGEERKYSDTKQRVDDLFFEFTRMVEGVAPRVFVAENVSGLVKGSAKGYFIEILRRLKRSGYRVEARLLDAQWLGVPQQRQRVIFVGVREDLGLAPAFPSPLPYRYSVRDALPWLGAVSFRNGGRNQAKYPQNEALRPCRSIVAKGDQQDHLKVDIEYRGQPGGKEWQTRRRGIDQPSATISQGGYGGAARHQAHIVTNVDGPSLEGYAIGAEYDRLNPGQSSERYFSLVRADASEPCPAVTAVSGDGNTAGVCHPTEKRKFTIAELVRICSFPDDFVLSGTYAQQWERLGRAVPPVMMRAIAEAVRDQVFARLSHGKTIKQAGDPRRLDVQERAGRAPVRRPRPRAAAVV